MRSIHALGALLLLIDVPLAFGQESRPAPAASQPAVGAASALEALKTHLHEVDFRDATFEEALRQLAELANINMLVRWSAIEQAGVPRDRPITLRVRNMSVAKTLYLLLSVAGDREVALAWRASPELLLISTTADLGAEQVLRVYDVSDLIMSIPENANFEVRRTHVIPRVVGRNQVQGELYASGVRVFDDAQTGPAANASDEENADERAALMQQLIDVITTSVEPDSWDINGGPGVIRAWRGQLVVLNSPFVHQKLAGLSVLRDSTRP